MNIWERSAEKMNENYKKEPREMKKRSLHWL